MIDLVLDDLVVLRNEWNDDITTVRLHNDSGTLRKLLIDGLLGQAWLRAGLLGEPRVLAPDLTN